MSRLREILLKLTLGGVAISALLGIVVIFYGEPSPFFAQVMQTTFFTTATSALAQFVDWKHRERLVRWRIGLTIVFTVYGLSLLSIWEFPWDGELWLTAFITPLVALTGHFAWQSRETPGWWLPARSMVVVLGIAWACWMTQIWITTGDRIGRLGVTLVLWSSLATLCIAGTRGCPPSPFRDTFSEVSETSDSLAPPLFWNWRWIGVAVAVLGFLVREYLRYERLWDGFAGRWVIGIGSIVVAFIYANYSSHVRLTVPWHLTVQRFALGLFIVSAVCVVSLTCGLDHLVFDLLGPLFGSIWIATGACVVSVVILGITTKTRETALPAVLPILAAAPQSLVEMQVTCPRCHVGQVIALGHSRCTTCGLGFEVQIDT